MLTRAEMALCTTERDSAAVGVCLRSVKLGGHKQPSTFAGYPSINQEVPGF